MAMCFKRKTEFIKFCEGGGQMNKKVVAFIAVLISFACFVFSAENMKESKLSKMRKLDKGTSYNQIVDSFGEPDEVLGSGLLIVSYTFDDSKLILHFFTGNKLQGLWEIKNSGEKIEYIPLLLDEDSQSKRYGYE